QLASLQQPFCFAFVGRVTRDKGWDTLVEAAELVARTGRSFRVRVIGDGDDLEAMKRRVEPAGLEHAFTFYGRLASAGRHGALRGVLAAVMPARFQAPAGYSPLEAAGQRVATIVAEGGGLPETAGPACPSFSAGDASALAALMSRYLDDPEAAVTAGC